MAQDDSDLLKLLAQEPDDLCVVSAHMQDALVLAHDMAYMPGEKRFALVAQRFDWLGADRGRCERRLSGLHFEHVLSAARRGFERVASDEPLCLLGVTFEPTEAPSGLVLLAFSGGATVRLEVECVETLLRDLGQRWKTRRAPPAPVWWRQGSCASRSPGGSRAIRAGAG